MSDRTHVGRDSVRYLAPPFLALLLILAQTTTAAAAPGKDKTAGDSIVLWVAKDGSAALLAPKPGISKAAYDPDKAALALGVKRANAQASYTIYGSGSIPACPDSCSTVSVSMTGNWTIGNTNATADVNGDAHSSWNGSTPFNADTQYLDVRWQVWGGSITVSFPPGGSFSGTSDSVYFHGQVDNNWHVDLYYNGVHFSASNINQILEYDTGTSRFGGTYYQTGGSDQRGV
jgi:hypothetical protein